MMPKATSDLLSHFEAKEVEGNPPGPSWNVAPTQNVPIVAERLDEGTLDRPVRGRLRPGLPQVLGPG
ncbi:hypothetical protein CVCC1112_3119 [Paenarthrobacter nicotinovorans]|nr:hypothetical protein CVCC1112_3119 [Paenarthrobacter nicotinovorans]